MPRIIKRLLLCTFALLALAVAFTPFERERARAASPTFNKEVVRILQQHCQTCHHLGDIAPMPLVTYREAKPYASLIKQKTQAREMPPWKPVPGCGSFLDARQLSAEEIATLAQWADAGAPEGDPADLPQPITIPDGWALGAPDVVLTPDADYAPPLGDDIYRCFSIPTALRGDRYVSAIEVRPGNRRIVHHVIAYIDENGVSAQLDAADPGPGYTSFGGPGFDNPGILGGWAPGARAFSSGEGVGTRLKNNSRVVIQVHYHPTSQLEKDRTQIGVYFAKTPVRKQLQLLPLVNTSFAIPPGEKRYEVTASFTSPAFPPNVFDAHIVSITPHMHLLGREIKVEATPPGKPTECLVQIDDWDFEWQGTYLYQQPIAAPGGTRLKLTAYYDNSAENPRNPNSPPKTVRWGEQTTDEMCLAFIGFTLDAESLPLSSPQVSDVSLDQDSNLVVSGSGFLPGADIEINGRSLRDTRADALSSSSRLTSNELWRVPAPPGQPVEVTVINPDGVRSAARSFTRPGAFLAMAAASAASYATDSLAPDSIIAAFGIRLATGEAPATSLPLPTVLAGTSVRVNGVLAPLFYVSPGQVNFLLPASTQTGTAVVETTAADGALSRSNLTITSTAPALFTANASGRGAPAALSTADGVVYSLVGNPDGTPSPIDAGDYLVLFGTGIRRAASGTVKITIGGIDAPVLYAGAQPDFFGLDQINTQIPPGLSGVVDLIISVNGKAANIVQIKIR
jgi:uncharacterized protein (TIGR03437 family)